ncbi:MAG: exodeoxyribonuclease I, partial [Desulfocapsa sp.]
ALADVYATIDLARLVRKCQPKLYKYLFDLRNKKKVTGMLNLQKQEIVLHVSSRYPATLGCIAPIVPLAQHPRNNNGIIVFDLRHDPAPLLNLTVQEIQDRLFVSKKDLPEGEERIPLKTVHINKCPALAPMATINPQQTEKWLIDPELAAKHADTLRANPALNKKIMQVHEGHDFPATSDPDQNLYGGGFFSDGDRRKMNDLIDMSAKDLSKTRMQFDDPRIPEMLFRYRARNWPQSLSPEEQQQWDRFRKDKLSNPEADSGITLNEYKKQLAEKVMQPETSSHDRAILLELADWPASINL